MSKTPVIFNHDASIDEYIACALLAAMETIDMKGIVITNADCLAESAMQVQWKINQFIGRTDIPTGLSRSRGWNAFPWSYRSDCLRLTEIEVLKPYPVREDWPPYPDGDALMLKLLKNAVKTGTPVTVVVTGPLTTLMDVLEKDKKLKEGIAEVIWMGGAVGKKVKGNLDPNTIPKELANPRAEWNAFFDPFAVKAAFQLFSGMKVFPLDISNRFPITKGFLSRLEKQSAKYPLSRFAYDSYKLVVDEPFYRMWDVSTVCVLERPDLYQAAKSIPLEIETWGYMQGAMFESSNPIVNSQDVFLEFKNPKGFIDYVVSQLRV